MRNLRTVAAREPAALGSLVASILPVLVLLDVIRIDEAGIAAVVVAINTAVGFGVRVLVSPRRPAACAAADAGASHAPERLAA